MAKNYDRVDLYFTRRGDFAIGSDGDVLDTSDDKLRSLLQEIRSRLQSEKGDWVLYPNLGADVGTVIGQPNNKTTAENLKALVTASLNQHNLVDTRDLDISYIPIGPDALLLRLNIRVMATDANERSDSIRVQILYNYTDHNVHIL